MYGPHGIRANSLAPARMITEKKPEMLNKSPSQIRKQKSVYPMGVLRCQSRWLMRCSFWHPTSQWRLQDIIWSPIVVRRPSVL